MSTSMLLIFGSKLDLEYIWVCRTLMLQKTCRDKYSSSPKEPPGCHSPITTWNCKSENHISGNTQHSPNRTLRGRLTVCWDAEGTSLLVLEPFRSFVPITLRTGGPVPSGLSWLVWKAPYCLPLPQASFSICLQRGRYCRFKKSSKRSQCKPQRFIQKYLRTSSWARY